MLNCDNQGYAKCILDEVSLTFLQSNADRISDGLVRMEVWFQIQLQVRDQLIKIADYQARALALLPNEAEDVIYQYVFNFLNEATGMYLPMEKGGNARSTIFDFTLQQLEDFNNSVADTANRTLILKDQLLIFCSTEPQIDILEEWRTAQYDPLSNILIGSVQAWGVVKLVFTSSNYTYSQQIAVYDNQKNKSPGP
jgi:hypothetical protein